MEYPEFQTRIFGRMESAPNLNYKTREDLSTENLEWLTLEITRPRSRPFLVATWYRPPDSPVSLFDEFEELVNKVDAGNWEFFLLGAINVDLMVNTTSANAVKLKYIFDIYGLDQLITEPTRITLSSRSLIGSISAALSCLVHPPREERLDA